MKNHVVLLVMLPWIMNVFFAQRYLYVSMETTTGIETRKLVISH